MTFPPKSPYFVSPEIIFIESIFQEVRGLDVGPRLVQKLIDFWDHRTSKIVSKIADEEVGHVVVGVFWFVSVCEKMGRTICNTFRDLLEEYNVEVKGPFNHLARNEAGLPEKRYDPSSRVDDNQKKLSQIWIHNCYGKGEFESRLSTPMIPISRNWLYLEEQITKSGNRSC